jgi:hypothetical protein
MLSSLAIFGRYCGGNWVLNCCKRVCFASTFEIHFLSVVFLSCSTKLSIQLVGDLRTNHLEERGNDMIQARINSDFDVKSATIQFFSNSHNSQSDRWIRLKFYVESLDMLSYLGLTFKGNQSSERHLNTGQQKLYEFCYLLPFDFWTSYLAMILFLKGCGTLF